MNVFIALRRYYDGYADEQENFLGVYSTYELALSEGTKCVEPWNMLVIQEMTIDQTDVTQYLSN